MTSEQTSRQYSTNRPTLKTEWCVYTVYIYIYIHHSAKNVKPVTGFNTVADWCKYNTRMWEGMLTNSTHSSTPLVQSLPVTITNREEMVSGSEMFAEGWRAIWLKWVRNPFGRAGAICTSLTAARSASRWSGVMLCNVMCLPGQKNAWGFRMGFFGRHRPKRRAAERLM